MIAIIKNIFFAFYFVIYSTYNLVQYQAIMELYIY